MQFNGPASGTLASATKGNRCDRLARRETIATTYETALRDLGDPFSNTITKLDPCEDLFTIWVDPKERDRVLHDLHEQGIGVVVNYRAVYLLT